LIKLINSNNIDNDKLNLLVNIINKINCDEQIRSIEHILINKKKDDDLNIQKKKVLLEYINGIMNNLNKKPINRLTDFNNITKNELLYDSNRLLLINMSDRLFTLFNKKRCGFYRKTDNLVLNCIRGMCKEIDMRFIGKRYDNKYIYSIESNK
jgi:hypothetical protein